MAGIIQTLVAASLCWFLASSLWIYPHSLSYFNESIGGPLNGPKHLLGSSVDWGQGLRHLSWSRETSDAAMVLADVGYYDPNHIGLRCKWVSTFYCRTAAVMQAANSSREATMVLSVNRQQEYTRSEGGLRKLNYIFRVVGAQESCFPITQWSKR